MPKEMWHNPLLRLVTKFSEQSFTSEMSPETLVKKAKKILRLDKPAESGDTPERRDAAWSLMNTLDRWSSHENSVHDEALSRAICVYWERWEATL